MKQQPKILLAASLFLTVATGFAQVGSSSQEKSNKQPSGDVLGRVYNVDPFTHQEHIVPGSDLKSIKFQGAKVVKVATVVKERFDPEYCKEASQGDPGGSMYCPVIEHGGYERAYQVTYSYTGPPLTSDEDNQTRFTFSVFFRPEELDGTEPRSFFRGKSAEAESLEVLTSRDSTKAFVIDEKASKFCSGNYVDGNWIPEDVTCEDKLAFREITVPSDYITIQVEPEKPRTAHELVQ